MSLQTQLASQIRKALQCTAVIAAAAFAASCGSDDPGGSAVASIRFVTIPTTVSAGVAFTAVVEGLDANGKRVKGWRDSVTLTVTGSALSGTTTVRANSGVATFSAVQATQVGSAVQLVAAAQGLTVVSDVFAVHPGNAAASQSTIGAPAGNFNANTNASLTFTFRDGFGNLLPNVPVAVSSNLASVTFTPAAGTTTATGTFATTMRATAEGSVVVTAVVDGTSVTFAAPLTVIDLCGGTALTFPGPANGSLPSGQCVADGRQTAVFKFTTTQQTGAAVTINSAAFTPLLELTTQPPGNNIKISPLGLPATAEWLLPAGAYQLRLSSLQGTGAFSVATAATSANSGCTPPPLPRLVVAAGTYTGQTLSASDCDFFGDGTLTDVFGIFDSRPCTITVKTSAFTTWLEAYDLPDLQASFGQKTSPPGTDAKIALPACRSPVGPLAIVVNAYNVGESGPYTMTITFTGQPQLRAGLRSDDATGILAPGSGPARLPMQRQR
ncbi:MAG TPA: hypothetical protein VE967_16235 [Gemmatimonadaceae bacterium]|nr:hypothetical protein [Gemmatimonadaceae bacterium]